MPDTCPKCHGTGQIAVTLLTSTVYDPCPNCAKKSPKDEPLPANANPQTLAQYFNSLHQNAQKIAQPKTPTPVTNYTPPSNLGGRAHAHATWEELFDYQNQSIPVTPYTKGHAIIAHNGQDALNYACLDLNKGASVILVTTDKNHAQLLAKDISHQTKLNALCLTMDDVTKRHAHDIFNDYELFRNGTVLCFCTTFKFIEFLAIQLPTTPTPPFDLICHYDPPPIAHTQPANTYKGIGHNIQILAPDWHDLADCAQLTVPVNPYTQSCCVRSQDPTFIIANTTQRLQHGERVLIFSKWADIAYYMAQEIALATKLKVLCLTGQDTIINPLGRSEQDVRDDYDQFRNGPINCFIATFCFIDWFSHLQPPTLTPTYDYIYDYNGPARGSNKP